MNTTPLIVPDDIRQALVRIECNRLHMTPDELPAIEFAAYFPQYATDNPAYAGPVVVVIWASDPGDHSTYIEQHGTWVHCRSS